MDFNLSAEGEQIGERRQEVNQTEHSDSNYFIETKMQGNAVNLPNLFTVNGGADRMRELP